MTEQNDPNAPANPPIWGATTGTGAAGGPPTPVQPRLPEPLAAAKQGSSSRLANVLLGAALVVAIGGVSFAAGRLTAPSDRAFPGGGQLPGGFGGAGDDQNPGGFGRLGGAIEGTIVAMDDTSLTLSIGGNGDQGLQIQIPLASSTAVHTQASAAAGDLATGQQVLIRLGTAEVGATPAPQSGNGPRELTTPATDITIIAK